MKEPSTNSTQTRYLTTGQVATYCGVNFRTVIRWIKKGYLQAHRLPGRGDHRVSVEDFIKFLNQNQLQVPAELTSPNTTPLTSSNKVLIIDDDVAVAKSIQRTLKLAGYDTQICNNSFEAGLLVEQYKPNLLTLDLHMPGLDGLSVLKALKSSNRFSKLKTLIISGANDHLLEDAIKNGANATLKKPFTPDELLLTIKGILIK